jgi:hypothetical protein
MLMGFSCKFNVILIIKILSNSSFLSTLRARYGAAIYDRHYH